MPYSMLIIFLNQFTGSEIIIILKKKAPFAFYE